MSSNAAIVEANFKQSTHNPITSNAAVLLALELFEKYLFAGNASAHALPGSSIILSATGDSNAEKRVVDEIIACLRRTTNTQSAKRWLHRQLRQNTILDTQLDRVVLSRKVGDETTETTYFFRLREVFALVHAALSDLDETAWPVPEKSTAEKERDQRLLEFDRLNEALAKARPVICSTGIRHAWLQMLDGYRGKYLPLSGEELLNGTIREFSTRTLRERLGINLPMDRNPTVEEQGAFLAQWGDVFFPWLESGEIPETILGHFTREGEADTLEAALHEAFQSLGVIPDDLMSTRIKNHASAEGIKHIPCDFIPFLATVLDWLYRHARFRLAKNPTLSPRDKLALEVLDWLQNGMPMPVASTSSETQPDRLQSFYLIQRYFDALKRSPVSERLVAASDLGATETLTNFAKAHNFLKKLPLSLEALLQNKETLEHHLKEWEKGDTLLRKEACVDFITNFFARWFAGDEAENHKTQANLFVMLAELWFRELAHQEASSSPEPASKPVIFLDDATLNKLRHDAEEEGTMWVSVYHINRVLLHALCYKTDRWTPDFASHLADILEMIRGGFKDAACADPESLRQSSWPDSLLMQVEGLLARYNNLQMPQENVSPVILTPACFTEADRVRLLDYFLDANPGETLAIRLFLESGINFPVNTENNWNYTLLHWAAFRGYTNLVRKLVQAGANVRNTDYEGKNVLDLACLSGQAETIAFLLTIPGMSEARVLDRRSGEEEKTPLHRAVESGNPKAVSCLLQAGALEQSDKRLNTPLHYACSRGHLAIVELLLDKDDFMDCVAGRRFVGATPLARAAAAGHVAIVKLLLQRGASLFTPKNKFESSPIYVAARGGHADVVTLLLQQGMSFNEENWISMLCAAAQGGNRDVLEMFIDKVSDVNAQDSNGNTPLALAAQFGHYEVAARLLQAGFPVNPPAGFPTPLYQAAKGEHPHIAKLLLDAGADANAPDKSGDFALNAALESNGDGVLCLLLDRPGIEINRQGKDGNPPLHTAVLNRKSHHVHHLLEHENLNPNQVDNKGQTALHLAVRLGYVDYVRQILKRPDAERNARDKNDNTPLLCAIESGLVATVLELLADEQTDVNAPNQFKESPLLVAHKHEEIIDALLAHPQIRLGGTHKSFQQSVLHKAVREDKVVLTKRLLSAGADAFARDSVGDTPLHLARTREIASLLLEKGALVDARNNSQETPFYRAIYNYCHKLFSYTVNEEMWLELLELLVCAGADVNVADYKGNTPLHVTISENNDKALDFLIQHKADFLKPDRWGVTPQRLAENLGRQQMVTRMQQDADEITSLHQVAAQSSFDPASDLLRHLQPANRDGMTYLHEAAINVNLLQILRTLSLFPAIDVNAQDIHGFTPLHWATWYNHQSLASFLFRMPGVDVNLPDQEGKTFLHWAAFANNDSILSLMNSKKFAAKVNFKARDKAGLSPLHLTVFNNSLKAARLLLNFNPDGIHAVSDSGETPLHLAARMGRRRLVTQFANAGADLLARDRLGQTPMDAALASQEHETARQLRDYLFIRCLRVYQRKRQANPAPYYGRLGLDRFFGGYCRDDKIHAVDDIVKLMGTDRQSLPNRLPRAATQGLLGEIMRRYLDTVELPDESWLEENISETPAACVSV